MTKIAVCYFGMTRSTKFVYESHKQKLYDILKNNNIDYQIYMHTWETEKNIIWENPCEIPNDYNEYKLLNPDFYKIERQDDFLKTINFENYFNENLYKTYGGDTHHEWRPQLILNHLCALESQKRAYNMVIESNIQYNFIIFIRPDVMVLNNFDINWLNTNYDIMIPNTDHHEGLNDRFAMILFNKALKYATRIDEIIDFRKNNGRIVSEKYVKYIVEKYYPNYQLIEFIMKIIRPNGSEA
jgi:hypothetical protein